MSFEVGEAVRTSSANPAGHNRLPRYLRGKRGRVVALRGFFPLADLRAEGRGDVAEMLYTVAFDAAEIWDTSAEPHETIHADLWESYLALC
ncbi:MAG: nitrile hydratase subunit beta [Candidatus Eremiobacteraeota bacterium]|nr:nitrile hydratase subunit beta [Candidatus Eremiobacteraeota bacterium]MBC5804592.1 nitrile hydratase subunit beta [Candidatus Eremiobacteraeota bacterium]MBC5822070.1 nitrile hydratase subunit beta [Candidatus Eremiobacteraeota bacterium]